MIETLEKTPDRVRRMLEGVSEAKLSRKPAADAFSLRENALHLRDVDADAFEIRVRRILEEENPFLPDFRGAEVARERDYNHQPIAPALDAFAASRARSVARLRNADLDRTGELEGVGRVTLRDLIQRWISHDAEHLAEMEALIA